MKRESIDIFLDIIDNYGDMWWVLECMLMSGIDVEWRIVTDAPLKIRVFLEKSGCEWLSYELIEKSHYDYQASSKVIFLTLHAQVDISKFGDGRVFFRINYLSFDPWYTRVHLQEHIASTREKKIIELTYSPLAWTWGIWKYSKTEITRWVWLDRMGLDKALEKKIWIPIFAYEKTLGMLEHMEINDDIVIFQVSGKIRIPWAIYFDYLTREDFWSLVDLSDISIVRGEISMVRAISSEKPFLWDMYKELGGWNKEESKGYLDWQNRGDHYGAIHTDLNEGKQLHYVDILSVMREWEKKKSLPFPNFWETLQKTLDKIGISL